MRKLNKLELLDLKYCLRKKNKKIKIKIAAIDNLNQTINIGLRLISAPRIEVKPHKKIKKCK